jgi:hypothetical protein
VRDGNLRDGGQDEALSAEPRMMIHEEGRTARPPRVLTDERG